MKHFILIGLPCVLLLLGGCSYENPPAIWNPELNLEGSPVIHRLIPDGKEFFDDMEIRIIGENFSPSLEKNKVYFNNEKAVLLSASPTELKVRRPRVTGDSITVKVVVDKQVMIAQFRPYRIEKLFDEMGKFTSSNLLYTITIDNQENIYAYAQGPIIYKISPDNVKTEFSLPPMTRAIQMRIGPGGYLYIAGAVGKTKGVFRLPPTGGNEMEQIYTSKLNYNVVEFDKNGRLFVCGKSSPLIIIDQSGSVVNTGRYDRFNVLEMRIVDDRLYVLGIYYGDRKDFPEIGLFASRLTPEGGVSEETVLLDWTKTEYSDSQLLSFALADDGDIFLGTSGSNPILILHPNGTIEPLYPTLLTPSAAGLAWGNSNYLYMMRGNEGGQFEAGRIFRIRLKKKGAPYYGRG